MRTPRIVDAMNYIDDDLVSDAVTYQRTTRTARFFRRPLLKACACFLVVALVLAVGIFQWRGGNGGAPLVLTAYAASAEGGSLITTEMKQGQSVPVSVFETSNGLKGVVLSYDDTDPQEGIPVSVITHGGNAGETIREISGIEMEHGKAYLFYVLPEDGAEQHTFPYFITDKAHNTVTMFNIIVEQSGNGYAATLGSVTTSERKTEQ